MNPWLELAIEFMNINKYFDWKIYVSNKHLKISLISWTKFGFICKFQSTFEKNNFVCVFRSIMRTFQSRTFIERCTVFPRWLFCQIVYNKLIQWWIILFFLVKSFEIHRTRNEINKWKKKKKLKNKKRKNITNKPSN